MNGTTWADLPTIGTTWDAVLTAQVGDVVEVGMSARLESEGVIAIFNVHTIVSAAAVNGVGGGVTGTTGVGISSWTMPPSNNFVTGGPAWYTLVAGDLSSGTVTLRLRYRTFTAANRTLDANTGNPLSFMAKNLGPMDPH